MTNDEIKAGIEAIWAPLPLSRDLRDKILAAVDVRFEALTLASRAFAQYALATDAPPADAVADFAEGFIQDAELRRVGR